MKSISLIKRLSAATTLGLLALIVLVLPASAGRRWCAADPIVSIDGTPVQIWVAVPDEYQAYVDDAIEVKVKSPKHLERRLLYTDAGFNGHGEKVSWGDLKDENATDGIVPIAVEVKVKFDKKRMEQNFGKATLEAELGKDMEIPLQVTVNVGEITADYETHVQYGTHKKTEFALSISTADAVVE